MVFYPNINSLEREPLADHCGIIVAYSPSQRIRALMAGYAGLKKIQTRGYDGVGICAINSDEIRTHYGKGKIAETFDISVFEKFSEYEANTWLLQTRYGTNGNSSEGNLQPLIRKNLTGERFATITNGQYSYEDDDNGASDTVQFVEELAGLNGDWDEKVLYMQNSKQGAWSTAIWTENAMYFLRDSYGLRPFSYGVKYDSTTGAPIYFAASETAALAAMGIKDFREVMPGEVIKIDCSGMYILQNGSSIDKQRPCAFENVYISSGKSKIHRPRVNSLDINNELTVEDFRKQTGALLGKRVDLEVIENIDYVVGVPGTGIAGGIAFAEAVGKPYIQVITDKNPQEDDARTFMTPDIQSEKEADTSERIEKHFYIEEAPIREKRIVLVDDSLIRGNISANLIRLLKTSVEDGGYGAIEVHVTIQFPPVDKPCHLGISTRDEKELIAAKYIDRERLANEGLTQELWNEVVECIRIEIGADSLTFSTAEDIYEAAGTQNLCLGCTIGNFPPV